MTKCSIKKNRKIVEFNKKNATEFADQIFSETDDGLKFIKLCCETLEGSSTSKKAKLHCAIGEAYVTFVKPSLKAPLSKELREYTSRWTDGNSNASTDAAIDALVENASLKDSSDEGKRQLGNALSACVEVNDSIDSYSYDDKLIEYIHRAKEVAATWRDEVLPLLK